MQYNPQGFSTAADPSQNGWGHRTKKPSKKETLKKMPFCAKREPIRTPMGPQKSTKTQKVPSKGPLFAPSQKHLKFHRFLDPPEPSESSSRVHKTSIFTFWPYPQNRLQSTSQNLPFGHLWAPKPPKVRKMNAPENTLKNRYAKIPKICQNDLPKS